MATPAEAPLMNSRQTPAEHPCPDIRRENVEFSSGGQRCAAWLYRPPSPTSAALPCVVLAHGWSGVREQRLDAYAERFAAAGFAVLVFDYRYFGASEGQPRQLLDLDSQLIDWASALDYVRSRPEIDPDRIAIWGTSLAGGLVLTTAARDHRVAAVVSQVPYVDGLTNLRRLGIAGLARMSVAYLRDRLAQLRRRPPHMFPVVGPPGSFAAITTPDAEAGYRAMDPPGSTWRNETPGRVALQAALYRPTSAVAQIGCPVFFAIADNDVVTFTGSALKTAAKTPDAEVRVYPGGHFDVYFGDLFEKVVADQIEFLIRTVGEGRPPTVSELLRPGRTLPAASPGMPLRLPRSRARRAALPAPCARGHRRCRVRSAWHR